MITITPRAPPQNDDDDDDDTLDHMLKGSIEEPKDKEIDGYALRDYMCQEKRRKRTHQH